MKFYHSLRSIASLFILCAAFCSCQRVGDKIEPTLSYAVQDRYLLSVHDEEALPLRFVKCGRPHGPSNQDSDVDVR